MIEDSHYGIVIHRQFTPLYCDDVYAKTYGFDTAEDILELKSLLQLIDPQDRKEAQRAYKEVMALKEKPRVRSFLNRDKHGHQMLILTVEHLVQWQGQTAMQITIVDLSSTLKAREILEEREQRYRQLVNGSIQGVLVHSQYKPLFCNHAYAEIFGFNTDNEVLALDSIEKHITHPQVTKDSLEKGFHKSKIQSQKKDGQTIWLQIIETEISWDEKNATQVAVMDITEQHLLHLQLQHQADYDELTQLLNRRAFSRKFDDALITSINGKNELFCLIMDLDDFKAINDTWGHHIGDKVIIQFANICRNVLPKGTIVGRWGGEEFVAVLANMTLEKASRLSETIRHQVEETNVFNEDNKPVRFTASFGLTQITDKDKTINSLLIRADLAMYQAKHFGKNQLYIANDHS